MTTRTSHDDRILKHRHLKASASGCLWAEPNTGTPRFEDLGILLRRLGREGGEALPVTLVIGLGDAAADECRQSRMAAMLRGFAEATNARCRFVHGGRSLGWAAVMYRDPKPVK